MTDTEGLSGKMTDAEGLSGKMTDAEGLSGKMTDAEGLSGKMTDAEGLSGKMTDTEGLSGKMTDTEGLSGKMTDAEGLSGKMTDAEGLSGKMTDTEGLSGKMTETEGLSGKMTDVEGLSGKMTDTEGLSGKMTDTEELSGKMTDTEELSGKMTDTEGLKRQSEEVDENGSPEKKRPKLSSSESDSNSQPEESVKVSSDDLYCACCNLSFSGPVPYQEHLAGKKHKRKLMFIAVNQQEEKKAFVNNPLNEESMLTCKLCKVQVTGAGQLHMHLNGKHHKKEEQKLKLENMKKKLLSGNSSDPSIKPPPNIGHYQCDICNLSFSGDIPYNAHMIGKRHLELAALREAFDKNKSSKNAPS